MTMLGQYVQYSNWVKQFKSKQVDRVAFTTLPVSYIFKLEYIGQKSNSELM